MMQALLNFPLWGASLHDRSPDKMACSKPRHIQVVPQPRLNKHKRKTSSLSVDSASLDEEVAKKRKVVEIRQPQSPSNSIQATAEQNGRAHTPTNAVKSEAQSTVDSINVLEPRAPALIKKVVMPSVVSDPGRRAELQQKIESQINLEILMKHKELRLIDQELAKCQVALEQIRRCEAIPYPGEPGSVIPSELVSTGAGPALEPRAGFHRPEQPAPWGVVDGPYSRHYEQWLLPDPLFDPVLHQSPRHSMGSSSSFAIDSRSTRGALSDRRLASKSRSTGSIASNLQALSTSYATPKEKSGPLIIKRPTDGQMVKLVCINCQRDNFSSVQGFLNHCRIAHSNNLDSHGAAAIACGVPVDANETTATESTTHSDTAVSTPSTGGPLVHPFITSARNGKGPESFPLAHGIADTSPKSSRQPKTSNAPKISKTAPFRFSKEMASGNFVPSPSTPRLSALVQKHGFEADFDQIVDQAKQKINLELVDELERSDDEQDDGMESMDVELVSTTQKAIGKPKPSIGGVRMPTSRARPTPLRTSLDRSSAPSVAGSVIFDAGTDEERIDFSPNTMETNPGLISDRDDEDYEDRESRSSEEDEWSENGADHSVQVRHHHHRDDEHIGILEGVDDMEGVTTCSAVAETLATSPPVKRKRGRPSKRGNKK